MRAMASRGRLKRDWRLGARPKSVSYRIPPSSRLGVGQQVRVSPRTREGAEKAEASAGPASGSRLGAAAAPGVAVQDRVPAILDDGGLASVALHHLGNILASK